MKDQTKSPAAAALLTLCICCAATLGAAELRIDHCPRVSYLGEALDILLRLPAGESAADWRVAGCSARLAHAATAPGDREAVLRITAAPTVGDRQLTCTDAAATHATGATRAIIDLVAPGSGAGLHRLADRLRLGAPAATEATEPAVLRIAVLVLPRREAVPDRRWALLRPDHQTTPQPCDLVLGSDAAAGDAASDLLDLIVQAQAPQVKDRRILIRLSAVDGDVAWNHRSYRQALAWLVADLLARGAAGIALAEPIGPTLHDALLSPLRIQIRNVAAAYRIRCVDTRPLSAAEYWEIAPGVLGDHLNADGVTAARALFAPWVADDVRR